MYNRKGFYADVNFDTILHPKKHPADLIDVLSQAHSAGMITRYGEVIIYGIGAERGTWGQFANLHLSQINFINARDSLTWFTNIYSTAIRNQGKTFRKCNFYLSQLQEIEPLMKTFGLQNEFRQKWLEVELHDLEHDLKTEWEQEGRISLWEQRTKTETIKLLDKKTTILGSVTASILKDSASILQAVAHPSELIGNAFIEGTKGLTLGIDDLQALLAA